MTGYRFPNVPTEGESYDARIFIGRIVNVRYKNYAVDVIVDTTGARFENVQLGMPYFHYTGGEGIYVMPEVGAHCAIVVPSDSTDPFVIGFLGVAEEVTVGEQTTSTTDETEDAAGESKVTDVDISYRNNRPLMRPGDICIRTRDGAFIHLRRGGVVQIGATAVSQRMYIPVRNFIRDFAENYEMETAGGRMLWELVHEDDEHNAAVQRFIWREYAEHSMASLMCSIGQLGDNYYEFVMAPQYIDVKTGEVKGDVSLSITFSKSGEYIKYCKKETVTVDGDRKITITGKHEESCNEYSQTVDGKRSIDFKEEYKSGKISVETLTKKDIRADLTLLGGSFYSAMLGELWLAWASTHIHLDMNGAPTSAPIVPPTDAMLSKKVKIGG
jgi:hypothetical protein